MTSVRYELLCLHELISGTYSHLPLYYKGVGVPIDKEKGAKMIKMACQSGQSRESCKILEQL